MGKIPKRYKQINCEFSPMRNLVKFIEVLFNTAISPFSRITLSSSLREATCFCGTETKRTFQAKLAYSVKRLEISLFIFQ